MVFDGDDDGTTRRQQEDCENGVEAVNSRRRISDSGIGGGRYRYRHPPSTIVNNVFDCDGAPSSSDRRRQQTKRRGHRRW